MKDKDGKAVSIKGITPGANDRSAKVEFYSAIEEGTYTLSLEGLKDKTTLQNSILPYPLTLEVGDNTPPELEGVAKEGRYITVQFSEEMSLEGTGSIANLSSYLIQYKGTFRALPAGTSIQVLDGLDAVMLILPKKIDGVLYDSALLTAVTVQGVEDANGKVLKNYSATETNLASTFTVGTKADGSTPNVTLVNPNTISVVMKQSIGTGVTASDFLVGGNTVDSVEVDGNKFSLTLRNDTYTTVGTTLSFAAGAFKSILGTDVSVATSVAVADAVKPEVVTVNNSVANDKLVIDFNEAITGTNATEMATDLVVTRVNGGKVLTPTVDYTTTEVSGWTKCSWNRFYL